MRKASLTMTVLLLVIALPILVQAQQLFDFNGQALVPDAPGGSLEMYSRIFDPYPALTPLPLDFENYEYTLVITDLVLVADGFEQVYENGYIAIVEDGGTVADYATPETFGDGEIILSGVITVLYRSMFTSTLGSAAGNVNWTGGTRLDLIAPADQLDWPLVAGINAMEIYVEPGYDENWDGKVEPEDIIIETTRTTWSHVKSLY